MRTNPISDITEFVLGRTGDHMLAGYFFSWVLTLGFLALFAASLWIARKNWEEDPTQRTGHHLATWAMRLLIGCMWFQGSLWKLPFPVSGGLQGWTLNMVEHAAFPFHSWIAKNIYANIMPIITPVVFFTEMGLAVSFMLGLFVRPMAVLGMLFVVHLYFGLYRHPAEWPWLYVFLIFTQAMFFLHNAGKSLGLDAMLARNPIGPFKGEGLVARLHRQYG
jgi:hypothetical protein